MNSRLTGILLIALMISGGATYLVYRVVRSRAQSPAQATTQVIVAARQIEAGTIIKEADIKVGPWPGAVPAGMATKKEAVLERGAIAAIYAGEPVMENRLAAAGAGGGLAATIPPGMRAVAVRVNDVVGASGFVVPGMRVDVLISGLPPGVTANNPKVKTLLQNIEVLSAGQNFQKDAEGKPVAVQVVNLLVNPEQAEMLSLASNETRIQLVLRNPLDTQQATAPGTQLATLYGEPVQKPAPVAGTSTRSRSAAPAAKPPVQAPQQVAPPPVLLIEVLNGPQRSEAKFVRRLEETK
jgi:pilus assembly protein CpaB